MIKKSNKNKFKKALVIFIDILGSKNCKKFKELYKKYNLFHTELNQNKNQDRDYTAYQRHIYPFSDCVYIIYDYKEGVKKYSLGELFDVALSNCEPILMKFLSQGVIFRGGIAYGDVYYDETTSMLFGGTVNRAYEYECKFAKFPRILMDTFVAKKVIKFTEQLKKLNGGKYQKRIDFLDHVGCFVKRDSDGYYYFNYFNSIQQGRDFNLIIKKNNTEFTDDLIKLCDKNIKIYKNEESIRSKYEWLKHYTKQSINHIATDNMIYKKVFWDEFVDYLVAPMISNVGVCLPERQEKIFDEFLDPKIFKSMEMDCKEDKKEEFKDTKES